jgi:hypothetical protein
MHAIRCVGRQPFYGSYTQFNMNKPAVPADALNRFRHAASQYARTAKSRASRLLALKEDIATLRKRGASYRAISELLAQSGITTSDTCVMNFCHRILMERRHKPFVARRVKSDANHPAARKAVPNATNKGALPAAPATIVGAFPVPTESAPVKTRGPHIAKLNCYHPENNMIKRLDLILSGKGGVGKNIDYLRQHLDQTLKTAVGRLVLCKPFLATAAVWLDSAARCCGLRLRFCIRKTCPAPGPKQPSVTHRQTSSGDKFRIELDKQVLDNRGGAGELLRRAAENLHQGFAKTGGRTGGQWGWPFEKEDRYNHLVTRQSEIKEKLGLTKNQAPSQVERVDNSEKQNETKSIKHSRRTAIQV